MLIEFNVHISVMQLDEGIHFLIPGFVASSKNYRTMNQFLVCLQDKMSYCVVTVNKSPTWFAGRLIKHVSAAPRPYPLS